MQIADMPGVYSVSVKRDGKRFHVFVLMDSADYAPFEKVIEKEISLSTRHPQYRFDFDVMPRIAEQELSLHVA